MLLDDGSAIGLGLSKSGELIPGDFSGSPAKASVTFTTPYDDTSYSIHLAAENLAGGAYSPTPENKTVSGFDVNLNSSNLSKLVRVTWQTEPYGE
jgi:hypothetical protein